MQSPEMPILPLRDIKLPPEPGFWPLAPGWWLVIVVLTVVLIWLCYRWIKHLKKKRRWQEIDYQLSAIEFSYQQQQDKTQLLTDLSVFLRRFVKFQLQQNQAVTLSGRDWIEHLNQLQEHKPFAAYATVLSEGVFQKNPDFDVNGLLETTRQFIKSQVMNPAKKAQKAQMEANNV